MDFAGFLNFITENFIQPVTFLILGATMVYFLWNIAEGIRKSDNPDDRSQMKTRALWGIIAIAVMASLWGLVSILLNTFDIRSERQVYPTSGAPAGNSFPSNPSRDSSSPWTCNFGGPCEF